MSVSKPNLGYSTVYNEKTTWRHTYPVRKVHNLKIRMFCFLNYSFYRKYVFCKNYRLKRHFPNYILYRKILFTQVVELKATCSTIYYHMSVAYAQIWDFHIHTIKYLFIQNPINFVIWFDVFFAWVRKHNNFRLWNGIVKRKNHPNFESSSSDMYTFKFLKGAYFLHSRYKKAIFVIFCNNIFYTA